MSHEAPFGPSEFDHQEELPFDTPEEAHEVINYVPPAHRAERYDELDAHQEELWEKDGQPSVPGDHWAAEEKAAERAESLHSKPSQATPHQVRRSSYRPDTTDHYSRESKGGSLHEEPFTPAVHATSRLVVSPALLELRKAAQQTADLAIARDTGNEAEYRAQLAAHNQRRESAK